MSETQRPRVFRLEPRRDEAAAGGEAPPARGVAEATQALPTGVVIAEQPDPFALENETREEQLRDIERRARRRGFSVWTKLFWSALTGLVGLAVGLWFWQLVDELSRAHPAMGAVGLALLALAVVALLALVVREARGLSRLAAAQGIKEEAERAVAADDGGRAKAVVRRLAAYQRTDPGSAAGRQALEEGMAAIVDGRGLLTLADRALMAPRDELARQAIAAAAKRVSVVTAISPRAIVDILFVTAQAVMLTRRIADIYGARPGTLGFLRLGRRILGHLAITGGVAITDSVLSQLVGHGLAARLSAKLGEGVLNGLLTARVGLAAIAACRPLPFLAAEEPKLQDVAGEILADPLGRRAG